MVRRAMGGFTADDDLKVHRFIPGAECARLVYSFTKKSADMKTKAQRGKKTCPQPVWLRVLALFCMALIGMASTAQVCHSHDEALCANVAQAGHGVGHVVSERNPGGPDRRDSGSDSAVQCPLCVAMHSAMPVTHAFEQVALLRLASLDVAADGIARTYSWRFEMASRPPPVERLRA